VRVLLADGPAAELVEHVRDAGRAVRLGQLEVPARRAPPDALELALAARAGVGCALRVEESHRRDDPSAGVLAEHDHALAVLRGARREHLEAGQVHQHGERAARGRDRERLGLGVQVGREAHRAVRGGRRGRARGSRHVARAAHDLQDRLSLRTRLVVEQREREDHLADRRRALHEVAPLAHARLLPRERPVRRGEPVTVHPLLATELVERDLLLRARGQRLAAGELGEELGRVALSVGAERVGCSGGFGVSSSGELGLQNGVRSTMKPRPASPRAAPAGR
jgi:hypothetical protein